MRRFLLALAAATFVAVPATAAVAQQYPPGPQDEEVLPEVQTPETGVAGEVVTVGAVGAGADELASTGADVSGLALLGGGAIALGGAAVAATRRRARA